MHIRWQITSAWRGGPNQVFVHLKPLRSMWPLHPGFDNQYKLVFTLIIEYSWMSVQYSGVDHLPSIQ